MDSSLRWNDVLKGQETSAIPAAFNRRTSDQAGTQRLAPSSCAGSERHWAPACAGMTTPTRRPSGFQQTHVWSRWDPSWSWSWCRLRRRGKRSDPSAMDSSLRWN